MPEITGIYGGTFDPPHLGHLILAAEALSQLRLDRLLWILTPDPPHKPDRPITPLPHRLDMLQRAIAKTPGFALSTVETLEKYLDSCAIIHLDESHKFRVINIQTCLG
jgi:nicotinate-nucleotide adenylyltransferase